MVDLNMNLLGLSRWCYSKLEDFLFIPVKYPRAEVQVKLTEKCPYNCKGCYYVGRKHRDFAKLGLLKELVSALVERYGAAAVTLHGGEAVLHPKFSEVVTELKLEFEDRVLISVTTNLPIHEHLSEHIISFIDLITLSLNAYFHQERIDEKLETVCRLRKMGAKVALLGLIRDADEGFRLFHKSLHAELRRVAHITGNGLVYWFERMVPVDIVKGNHEFMSAAEWLFTMSDDCVLYLPKLHPESKTMFHAGCTQCWTRPFLVVDVDGTVTSCSKYVRKHSVALKIEEVVTRLEAGIAEANKLLYDIAEFQGAVFFERRMICRNIFKCPLHITCSYGCPYAPFVDGKGVCAAGLATVPGELAEAAQQSLVALNKEKNKT